MAREEEGNGEGSRGEKEMDNGYGGSAATDRGEGSAGAATRPWWLVARVSVGVGGGGGGAAAAEDDENSRALIRCSPSLLLCDAEAQDRHRHKAQALTRGGINGLNLRCRRRGRQRRAEGGSKRSPKAKANEDERGKWESVASMGTMCSREMEGYSDGHDGQGL